MEIRLDPAGIVNVLNEAPAIAALRERAGQTVDDAKRTGPKNPAHRRHVVDQLAVGQSRTTNEGAVVEIEWPSPFWHFVEFGTVNFPPSRVVTRGAQNAGLRVVDSRG